MLHLDQIFWLYFLEMWCNARDKCFYKLRAECLKITQKEESGKILSVECAMGRQAQEGGTCSGGEAGAGLP